MTLTPVWIAAGGACGAVARYGVYVALAGQAFPAATVVVNLTGAFALGMVVEAGVRRPELDWFVAAVGIGFLGAFTTFSAFGLETARLLERGAVATALVSAALNVFGSVAAAAAGVGVMRLLDR